MLLRFLGLAPRVPALIHRFKEIWISLDKLPSLWMLIQSARLGERGSIPEGSQRPSIYSQKTFFFLNQRYFPKSLSTCVSKSAFTSVKKQTLASASQNKMPGHLDTQMDQHPTRVSVAALKAGIPSFRRAWACLHTTGYFRGDSLQKSHLKTRKNRVLK